MKPRPMLLAFIGFCLAGLVVTAPQSNATCQPAITDARNDAPDYLDPRRPNRDDADILAADVRSDRATVTVIVRLATTRTRLPVAAPGRLLDTTFALGQQEYNAYWYVGVDGTKVAAQDDSGHSFRTTFSVDAARGLMRIAFHPSRPVPSKAKLSGLEIYTTDLYGTNEEAEGVDLDGANQRSARRLATTSCLESAH